jgi:hypothetical protein
MQPSLKAAHASFWVTGLAIGGGVLADAVVNGSRAASADIHGHWVAFLGVNILAPAIRAVVASISTKSSSVEELITKTVNAVPAAVGKDMNEFLKALLQTAGPEAILFINANQASVLATLAKENTAVADTILSAVEAALPSKGIEGVLGSAIKASLKAATPKLVAYFGSEEKLLLAAIVALIEAKIIAASK